MTTIKTHRAQFSTQDREKIMKKTGCKCGKCGKLLTNETMTVDHVLPIQKGGLNDEYNLIALCYDCNMEKANFLYPVSYYKHILPEYVDSYIEYNNYAMEITPGRRIMPHDRKDYKAVSRSQAMLINKLTRSKSKNKDQVRQMLGVTLHLEPAYPGDAERIYEFTKKNDANPMFKHMDHYYTNHYSVLDDIANGEVYILENASELCGVFSFHYVSDREIFLPQARNIMDAYNYSIHAVMTYAAANKIGAAVYDHILSDFFFWQTDKGYMPLYFNILKTIYRNKDYFASSPWAYLQFTGDIEFFNLSGFKYKYKTESEKILRNYSSEECKDSDVEYLAYMLLSRKKMSDMDAVDKEFLAKYEGLNSYFFPEEYSRYNERSEINMEDKLQPYYNQ